MVEEAQEVVAIRERDVFRARLSEPTRVVADDAIPIAQGGHLLVPHPQVRDASVDERQRMTLALHFVGEPAAGDVKEGSVGSGHRVAQ
jgi:hypothetical protein